jgi:hypothetical protein
MAPGRYVNNLVASLLVTPVARTNDNTHWGGRRKAAQKTNVIFAICNGGATMRGETLRIPRRR